MTLYAARSNKKKGGVRELCALEVCCLWVSEDDIAYRFVTIDDHEAHGCVSESLIHSADRAHLGSLSYFFLE